MTGEGGGADAKNAWAGLREVGIVAGSRCAADVLASEGPEGMQECVFAMWDFVRKRGTRRVYRHPLTQTHLADSKVEGSVMKKDALVNAVIMPLYWHRFVPPHTPQSSRPSGQHRPLEVSGTLQHCPYLRKQRP